MGRLREYPAPSAMDTIADTYLRPVLSSCKKQAVSLPEAPRISKRATLTLEIS